MASHWDSCWVCVLNNYALVMWDATTTPGDILGLSDKINMCLPYDLATPLTSIHAEKMEPCVPRRAHTVGYGDCSSLRWEATSQTDQLATTWPRRHDPECKVPARKATHCGTPLVSHSWKVNSGTRRRAGWVVISEYKGRVWDGLGGRGLSCVPAVAVPTHIYTSSRIPNRTVH